MLRIKTLLAKSSVANSLKAFAKVMKVLFIVSVCVVTMADIANATEMSAEQTNMKLQPENTANEKFVVVRPGGNMAELCKSFCLDKESCVAIYYREGDNKYFFYNSYLFLLKDATGFNTTFKIWTK